MPENASLVIETFAYFGKIQEDIPDDVFFGKICDLKPFTRVFYI